LSIYIPPSKKYDGAKKIYQKKRRYLVPSF
jgi:hypothetical protein